MGLELDELVYSKVVRYFKKRRLNDESVLQRQITLQEIKPKLTIMARALCGKPIELYAAEKEGGFKNNNFFLPTSCALFEDKENNYKFYLFRLFYLSVQKRLNFQWETQAVEIDDVKSYEKALETAPEVLKLLFDEFPPLKEWHDFATKFLENQPAAIENSNWLYGKWMRFNPADEAIEMINNPDDSVKNKPESVQPLTTLHARAVEEIISKTIDKKQQEDYVLLHSFEKIETVEEFNGNWRDFDGSDELEKHENALDEINMRYTVRVDDTTHSVYQADFVENTSVAESSEVDDKGFHVLYPEWNFKKRSYLENFCKVYPKTQLKTNPAYYQKTLASYQTTLMGLRKMLTNVNNKMQQLSRQTQGDSFDLCALTDLYTDIHSKISPDERVYISSRKKEKDISILLLLDLSLSSDGYVAGNRVIDVEKEVSILFGEILNEFNIPFAIDGFYSKTRNFSTYITIKDFNENWQKAKHKIGAMEVGGYTRIGPALRHAGARFKKVDSENKWIIMLSDGKPNDYDKYEGQYGVQDVKQALRELNEQNINSYALAIEAQAKYYLPQMFGQNHYQILSSPDALLKSLVKLYEKIKHA